MSGEQDKKHILLIEDSPTQAQYMRLLLEDAGYRVTFAETGQKGIEIAEASQPDVVLLDVVASGPGRVQRLPSDPATVAALHPHPDAYRETH